MPNARQDWSSLSFWLAVGVLAAALFSVVWLYQQPRLPILERIIAQGELVIATREAPAVMFRGAAGRDGFEHALTRRFADFIGVDRVRYVFPDTVDELLDAVAHGRVHLAAAGLTATGARAERVRFSVPYKFVTEELVYRRGSRRPRTLDDIAPGDLHVVAGSSHEETLTGLRSIEHPALDWTRHQNIGSEGLLAAVDRGDVRLTVADSSAVALNRRIHRHVATAFELGDPLPIAWAFDPHSDNSLLDAANRFISSLESNGELPRLRSRYFGHTGRLNFVDVREFWRQVRDRLAELRPYFEEAAAATGLDWRLLAAIGYQESHWKNDAVSPTGVRGIMMLTQTTAEQVGVSDRNDPRQSIMGGARYLRIVERKIPARIDPVNRLWFTLAGYNVGFGHLEDARILTERDGGNPDVWLDVKQRLPLLSKKEYYSTLRYGFARGNEPVNYVDNIRNYYDLLVWFTTTEDTATKQRLLAEDA
jgi:membrane-bound lytic murein transglycosylase F